MNATLTKLSIAVPFPGQSHRNRKAFNLVRLGTPSRSFKELGANEEGQWQSDHPTPAHKTHLIMEPAFVLDLFSCSPAHRLAAMFRMDVSVSVGAHCFLVGCRADGGMLMFWD
jgi:hypothetical protein